MGTEDERAAFMWAILANPRDDLPRLVYADWLDERGEDERADFIRRACAHEYAHADSSILRHSYTRSSDVFWHTIIQEWRTKIGEPLPTTWHWQRGFVSHVELPCAAFLEHAAAIFAAHPVTSVKLTDKATTANRASNRNGIFIQGDTSRSFDWNRTEAVGTEDQTGLPEELFGLMCKIAPPQNQRRPYGENRWLEFGAAEEANEWLSKTCVALGRKRAGLSPLSAE